MRIEVDPDALIAAGRQTGALGGQLARLSDALGAALGGGISSGIDPAGLNFGMKYGQQAGDFTSAVADAANAFTSVGMLLEASGFNYRNADAASTIGGPGPARGVGADPGKALPAHVPPGPNGVTVPPPSKWYLIQPLLQVVPGLGQVAGIAMTWPSGNAAMMGVTATQWRNFATGFALIEPQLTGMKAAVAAQQIPEGAAMTTALDSLGTAISSLAEVSSSVAQSISDFASGVQETQDAIRRLLDRLSLDGLWDTVTGFLTGEGDDILREVARDVGTVLHNFQQQVKGIVGLLDELTGLIGDAATAFQKWIRPILVEQFGDGAGNALANAVTLYTDVQVGAVTGLIGTVSGVVAMADPDTWKGMAEMALSVAKDPSTLPGVLENMGKEFVAWDKWSGDHPGRAAGEAAFNIGSLFVPGGALSKTGSVAKGLNLSRRVLEEGRLPGVRELGSWTRGTPNPIETPRVPEFTPAAPGGVPPVRPEGVPPVGPGQSTGAGGPSGAGPPRTGEPPAPAGRPPTPGAEGGSGLRAPVDQSGRGGSGAEAAPRSEPTASPNRAPEAPTGAPPRGESAEPASDANGGDLHSPHDHPRTPVHSHELSGDGWHRVGDKPGDPSYGQPLEHHWESGDYPSAHEFNRETIDLVENPAEPYGHDEYGNPLTKDQYDERYNLLSPEGDHWQNYPPNDGAVPGTRVMYESGEAFLRDHGQHLDRIGGSRGAYLGVMPDGVPPSFESRALPITSLDLPYHTYTFSELPDGWSIEVSKIAPAFGRDGGALQVLVFNSKGEKMIIDQLLDIGVLE